MQRSHLHSEISRSEIWVDKSKHWKSTYVGSVVCLANDWLRPVANRRQVGAKAGAYSGLRVELDPCRANFEVLLAGLSITISARSLSQPF